MRTKFAALFLLACTGAFAWAMLQDEQPIFRVSTERVLIEFIAIDKDGKVVTDLDKNDIEVKIDGKKQKVDKLFPPLAAFPDARWDRSADWEKAEVPEAYRDLPPSMQPRGPIRTAIVLDSRVIDSSNFHHSRRAIEKFVAESLEDDHYVMIADIDRKLEVKVPFTRDREALLAAIKELKPATLYNPLDTSVLRSSPGANYTDELMEQMSYLRSSMRILMHSLSAHPGRKHVVFFSEGYPMNPVQELEFAARQQMSSVMSSDARQTRAAEGGRFKDPGVLDATNELVSWANAYGVSFYTVDARGLIGVPGLGADRAPGSVLADTSRAADLGAPNTVPQPAQVEGGQPEADSGTQPALPVDLIKQTALDDVADAQNFLQALAAGTNGSAFFNSNDLERVLRASTREQQFVYLASIEPKIKDKDKVKYRKVEVKTDRKDVIIRAQSGFYNLDPQQLRFTRWSEAFQRPEYFNALQPIAQVQHKGGKVEATFGIPGAQIAYAPAGDKRRVDMVFLGQVFKKNGDQAFENMPIQRPFAAELTAEQYAGLTSQPLTGHQELDLPPGEYRLVFLADDQVAGTLGATAVEFEVR